MTDKIKSEDFIKAFGSGAKEPEHHITTENAFPMEIVAGKCPIEAGGNCPLRPQGEWVPVSERLPNINTVYNVTRIIDGTRITDASYFDGQNTWHRDTGVNHGRPYLTDIIAWQELPEPYKADMRGEEE